MLASARQRLASNGLRIGWLLALVACIGCGHNRPDSPAHNAEYTDACQLLAAGKAAKAIAAFDNILTNSPQYASAFLQRANAHRQLDELDFALNDYTEAIRLYNENPNLDDIPSDMLRRELIEARVNRAKLQIDADKLDEGINDLTEALKIDPAQASAHCSRGLAFLKKGFTELAVDDFSDAIRACPTLTEAVCGRAQAWLKEGRYTEAMKDARLAIRLNTQCADAFVTLGTAILSSLDGRPDRAIEYLTEAVRLDKTLEKEITPRLAQAYFAWGIDLDRARKTAESDNAFAKAEQLDPKYAALRIERQTGNKTTSTAIRHEVAKPILGPLRSDELCRQANASLEQKQYADAIGRFNNIIRVDAECAEAWCGRGIAFLEKGILDSAIQDFNRAIQVRPDFAQAYCHRSRAYSDKGYFPRALRDATQAIQLKPDLALAYCHRAVAYVKENAFQLALVDLDEAIVLNPDLKPQAQAVYAEAYRGLGIEQTASRHWNEAIASLQNAVEHDEANARQINILLAKAHRERGLDRAGAGDFELAVSDLKTAFKLAPDDARNHHLYGLTCCRMARASHDRKLPDDEKKLWELALQHLNRASSLEPELRDVIRSALLDAQHNLDNLSKSANTAQLTSQ